MSNDSNSSKWTVCCFVDKKKWREVSVKLPEHPKVSYIHYANFSAQHNLAHQSVA